MKRFSVLTLGAASLIFAGSAYATDCSMSKAKTQTQAQIPAAVQTASTSAYAPAYTAVASSAASNAKIHYAGDKKAYKKAKGTIVDAAVATEALSTLVAAVKAADLVDTLSGPGPFTFFAPTNDAFAALTAGTVDTLLMPENKAKLQGVLTAHVVAGKLKAADIIALAKANGGSVAVETVSGDTLTAILSGETLYVLDESGGLAGVAIADVKTSNGVVHVVDKVLLPQ